MNPPAPARPWLRIIVRSLLLLVILLATAGFLYENISETRDRRFNRMPGQLIEVGGYKMHIDCTGQGDPVVVLDAGLGDSYVSWRKVQPHVAQVTRVCSYDRAGLGYSDSSPRPRTSKVMAEELHTLLQNAGITGPVILVGHLEFTMPLGIPRVMGFCGHDAVVRAAECNFHSAREGVAELKTFSESAAQTATTGSLGDMPLAVLSHDPGTPQPDLPEDLVKPTNDAWQQMQTELAHLSTRSTQVIAKNSGHYIQLDHPEVVVDAVRSIVDQVRQDSAHASRH